jgi:hypothetical protein
LARPSIEFAKEYFRGKTHTIVEVGVRNGQHALNMYQTLNPDEMYLVDCYKNVDIEGPDSKWTKEDHETWFNEANKLVNIHMPNAKWLINRSRIASLQVPDGIDLVYIDGSHYDLNVTVDIACWYPKLKIDGILCGHDYNRIEINQGVHRAVHRFFNNVESADVDWWIVKKCMKGFKS